MCGCSVWLLGPAGERGCVQSHFPLRRKLECSLWSLVAHAFTHTRTHTLSCPQHKDPHASTHTALVFLWMSTEWLPGYLTGWMASWMLRGKSDMNPVWCLFLHSDNSIRKQDGLHTATYKSEVVPKPQAIGLKWEERYITWCYLHALTRRDKAWPTGHHS